MLTNKEIAVMKVVYDKCKINKDICIIPTQFIFQSVPEKYKLTIADIDIIIKQLDYDGYFTCTKSVKKGESVNVIELQQKGKAFARELVQRRRELTLKIVQNIVFAISGALIALVIRSIFK